MVSETIDYSKIWSDIDLQMKPKKAPDMEYVMASKRFNPANNRPCIVEGTDLDNIPRATGAATVPKPSTKTTENVAKHD
jgi:hypothetical protein